MSLKQFRADMTAITFYLDGIYKLLKEQRKAFYLCNGKVPYCKKTIENTPELIFLEKCRNCPEFDSETRKEILHGDTIFAEVNIQITCKHRGLCDRIEEHLKNKLDNVSCTNHTT